MINKDKKQLCYAELKSNLNLDTEKSKVTIKKCLEVYEELKILYPNYIIKWNLVTFRYINRKIIPDKILYKYEYNDNVIGINDYYIFTNENYIDFLNIIAKKMFTKF